MTEEWQETIFRQKGLWEVYRLSRQTLPRSKWNKSFANVAVDSSELTICSKCCFGTR